MSKNEPITVTEDGSLSLAPGEAAIIFRKDDDFELFLRKPEGAENPTVPRSILTATSIMILLSESEEFLTIISIDMAKRWSKSSNEEV